MFSNSADFADSFSFWKNLVLCLIFFTVAPLTLASSLFALISLSQNKGPEKTTTNLSYHRHLSDSGVKVFASFPGSLPVISGEITGTDARPEIIRQYLASFASPLESYALFIVSAADKYGLDFRLTTAIAQQESNLCKIVPPGTHNCWGWGIHSQGTLGFASFEEGVEEVSRGLREEYLNKGYETPEQIMSKYTPLSNGSWAFGVKKFMEEME